MMEDKFLQARARALSEEARLVQQDGDLERAIDLYSKSIRIHPTAEAHTARGWAYSFQDRLEEAVRECERAIALDPGNGAAYNDLGSYLVALGQVDEAIEYFQRSKAAPHNETRHYPCINLAEVYAARGLPFRAIHELREAKRLCPEEPRVDTTLGELIGQLN